MKVSVKVPATTANLGPGFDCLGLALPIYNTITVEETIMPGTGIEINIIDETNEQDIISIPTDENNIVYKAIELLIAANELLGRPADEAALLSIATEIENHPDNITPAVVGGFVVSSLEEDGSVIYSKMNWPKDWNITVCIPDYELSTSIARSVLPAQVPMKDAIFNLKHVGMLVQAVNTQDEKLMKAALDDRLHQQYREKLIPGLKEIKEALKHEENVMGVVISGAGPAILVISYGNNLDKIRQTVSDVWLDLNVKSKILTLQVESNGAQIID